MGRETMGIKKSALYFFILIKHLSSEFCEVVSFKHFFSPCPLMTECLLVSIFI